MAEQDWNKPPGIAYLQGRVPKKHKNQRKQARLPSPLPETPALSPTLGEHTEEEQEHVYMTSLYRHNYHSDRNTLRKVFQRQLLHQKRKLQTNRKKTIFSPRQTGSSKTLGYLYYSSTLVIQKHSDTYASVLESKSTRTSLDT